ncbi:MAG: hypothetical protein ACYDHM_13605 [Acidiferrobacterales bacterium]
MFGREMRVLADYLTANFLRESFGELWGYEKEGWARRFFEN